MFLQAISWRCVRMTRAASRRLTVIIHMKFSQLLFAATLVGTVNPTHAAESTLEPSWHQTPMRISAGKMPLDTVDAGGAGHAAPYLIDMDGDGKRDLVVGDITGHFFFY